MIATETKLKDCYVINPTVHEDERGYFYESFNLKKFQDLVNRDIVFVQDNESYSKKGVLRGLHFQKGQYAQAKLVRVTEGEVLDVAVDLRQNSPSFGEHFSIILSCKNKSQLFVPRGFAHGFVVLSESAKFSYKCDNFYNKEFESGILYNDETLNIDWRLKNEDLIVSAKDLVLPTFQADKLC